MSENREAEGDSTPDEQALRAALDAFNRRDLEGMLAYCDPGIEFMPLITGVTNEPYRGHRGVERWFAGLDETFETFTNEYERVESLADGWLLVEGRGHGRGRTSGMELTQAWVQLVRMREGRMLWWRTFRTREEALEVLRAQLGDAGGAGAAPPA